MKERWTEFYTWAKEYNPSVYVVQKDGSHYNFGRGFWNISNSDMFVLGDDDHRDELLGNTSNLTSNLMMSKNDWEDFEKFLIANKNTDVLSKSRRHTKSADSVERYSMRQRRYGKETKACPRFQVMVEIPEIGNRYYKKEIRKNDLSPRDQPCHAAVKLILDNREVFQILVANKGIPTAHDQIDFLKKLDFALEVTTLPISTRRKQILKYKWNKLEEYIESLEIVSDEDLLQHHKDFELNSDSKLINAKIPG